LEFSTFCETIIIGTRRRMVSQYVRGRFYWHGRPRPIRLGRAV